MSNNSRIFHGIEPPKLYLYTPTTLMGRPIHSQVVYTLECPQDRTISIQKQTVSASFMKSGRKSEWIQHYWMSGSISWGKLSWEDAQALMEAFLFETTDSGYDNWGYYIGLKVFGDDPYILRITLDSDLDFPKLGKSAMVGHSCSISWKATLAWDEMRGDAAEILTLKDYWYASGHADYVTWG